MEKSITIVIENGSGTGLFNVQVVYNHTQSGVGVYNDRRKNIVETIIAAARSLEEYKVTVDNRTNY